MSLLDYSDFKIVHYLNFICDDETFVPNSNVIIHKGVNVSFEYYYSKIFKSDNKEKVGIGFYLKNVWIQNKKLELENTDDEDVVLIDCEISEGEITINGGGIHFNLKEHEGWYGKGPDNGYLGGFSSTSPSAFFEQEIAKYYFYAVQTPLINDLKEQLSDEHFNVFKNFIEQTNNEILNWEKNVLEQIKNWGK